MTPEQHIGFADLYLEVDVDPGHYYNLQQRAQYATIALAHIEMAKWKERHDSDESA